MPRLIDEDAVKRRMHETMDYQDLYLPVHFEMCMNDAPTVEPASPWHRVEEKLPDIGKLVLVWNAGDCWLATRTDDEVFREGRRYWKNTDGEYDRVEKDMYWMPIEPPKEENDG